MQSLVTACTEKYGEEDVAGADNGEADFVIFVPKSRPGRRRDDSGLRLPPRLTMDNEKICTVGDVDDHMMTTFSIIQELDLTKNHISDFAEILKILRVMPNLHFLNLTNNPLQDGSCIQTDTCFANMKTLILNNTQVEWRTVVKLLDIFPSLCELYLSVNKYDSVELPHGTCWPTVTKLHMNDSSIDSWHHISKLGHAFPSLEALTIINTDIDQLPEATMYEEFSKLNTLNISQCNLNSWEAIGNFRKFPALTHLQITGVPFLENQEEKVRRLLLIARLPDLTHLNRSHVQEQEREDAERAFVRLYQAQDNPPARLLELQQKYGRLNPLVQLDLKPDRFKNKVRFEDREEWMYIERNQTVGEFKKLLQNFTGVPCKDCIYFFYEMLDGNIIATIELKLAYQKLMTLNIREGDVIQIYRKEDMNTEVKVRKS